MAVKHNNTTWHKMAESLAKYEFLTFWKERESHATNEKKQIMRMRAITPALKA